jgi:hypothetical protein
MNNVGHVRIADCAERILWTAIAAGLANIGAATILGVDAWKAAVATGLAAGVNAVLVIARWRLSVLPDPGGAVAGFGVAAGYAAALKATEARVTPAVTPTHSDPSGVWRSIGSPAIPTTSTPKPAKKSAAKKAAPRKAAARKAK